MEIFETDAVTVTIVHIFLLIVLISWNVEAFQQPNLPNVHYYTWLTYNKYIKEKE